MRVRIILIVPVQHAQTTRGDRTVNHDSGKPEHYFVAGEEGNEQQPSEAKRSYSDLCCQYWLGSFRCPTGTLS